MRLIDADALMPKLKAILEAENQIYGRASWDFSARCVQAVENAPTIESEIIRCKDCKYMIDTGDDLMCDNAKGWVVATTSDFGCVLAERRTE